MKPVSSFQHQGETPCEAKSKEDGLFYRYFLKKKEERRRSEVKIIDLYWFTPTIAFNP
jgi:hypothetical protein